MDSKIKKLSVLYKAIDELKMKSKKIVFTNGCFDIIHYGHVKYLQDAKKLGDYLIVGLNSDKSVKKIKGSKRPIMRQLDRARILEAMSCVDFIVIFDEPDPLKLISALKPDILVKGADWNKKNIVGRSVVESFRGRVKTIPFVKDYSTSSIIQTIIDRYGKKI